MGGLRGDVVVNNSSDSLKSIHDQLALLHSEIAEIRLDSKQEVNGLRTEIKGQVPNWGLIATICGVVIAAMITIGGQAINSLSQRIEASHNIAVAGADGVAKEWSEWKKYYLAPYVTEKIASEHIFLKTEEFKTWIEGHAREVTLLKELQKNSDDNTARRLEQLYGLYKQLDAQIHELHPPPKSP